jgi:formylglycine-generating enzyme required for sulfatase activity
MPLVLPCIAQIQLPKRLGELGFVGHAQNVSGEYVIPPLCPVAAGSFLMGSDPTRDKQAGGDEQPQHTLTLPAYAIARFPVTVAEYTCFLSSGRTPPKSWLQQRSNPDHAVEFVSWQDAVAYAAWLAQVSGDPWRLTTEAEWEKAARGTDGRLYPWGDQWGETRARANKWFGGAAAIGSYPSGASPYGVQDLAGNVWEWTSSLKMPYPYNESDGRENPTAPGDRVLRGGSWYSPLSFVRAAYRFGSSRTDVERSGAGFGFRLVLAAPGSA